VNFAREGYPFIIGSFAIAAALYAAAVRYRAWPLWFAAFVFTILALWVAYFFRDPERTGDRGDTLVVAPADGKLVMITEVDEPTFVGGRAKRLSIFMNVFSVHVNRYPVSGTVRFTKHTAGKFLNAAAEKSSDENEQSSVGIESGRNKILVRQIAGLIARRIITYSKVGEHATQGDRFGLIRFGSRVDVFVPTDALIRVQLGQQTSAGTTVLAELVAR
jgi:phosphatidylserine decarboxylase